MATIAVDLDGVCYEWDKTVQYMLRTYRGASVHQQSESWDWVRDNVPQEDWRWVWSDGVRLGLFRYGHMVTGARIGLEALADEGHQLTIVTHRPGVAVHDTVDWISLYFKDIPLAGLHILTNGEPKTSVHADVLIDDKPANLEAWADAGRTAIQFVRRWNTDYYDKRVIQANGWHEVVDALS